MANSNNIHANKEANNITNGSQQVDNEAPLSHLLSELPIHSSNLLFGLNFKHTKVPKSGLINRFKNKTESMDIDLSCIIFAKNLSTIDTVWFKKLRDGSGAIRHQGDSLNGNDRGEAAKIDRNIDVETIEIRLSRLPQTATHIALLVSSYKDHDLNKIERGNMYISDDEGNEIYASDLALLESNNSALCVAMLSRELDDWRFTIKNLSLDNTDMDKMTTQVRAELNRIYGG